MKEILYIGFGGFFGAISRHFISSAAFLLFPRTSFPVGTFLVNVLGSFLIGLSAGLFQGRVPLDADLRLMIVTGFLGAFTTFSTFSMQNVFLFREGHLFMAVFNIIANVLVTLAAAWAAYLLARSF